MGWFKTKKQKRLMDQRKGWELAFQLISNKYKPSKDVEAIACLLNACSDGATNLVDITIDDSTVEELNAIGKEYLIECDAHGKTAKQYYNLAKAKCEQYSKEYSEFVTQYNKLRKRFNVLALLMVCIMTTLVSSFFYNGGLKYLQAEKCMREGNYKAALEWYSQCKSFFGVSNKQNSAMYQMAETYVLDKKYRDALELYNMCGDYKDAKDRVKEVERTVKEDFLQSLGIGMDSFDEIYTLGNDIPCGLIKFSISYDDFLNANKDKLVHVTKNSLTYDDYSLYGYPCYIKYSFGHDKILNKIEVISPYGQEEKMFRYSDMKEISDDIQRNLNVEPDIYMNPNSRYNCDIFKFIFATNDGLDYELVSNDIGILVTDECKEIESRFSLIIKAI